MDVNDNKERIIVLIVKRVYGAINQYEEKELDELMNKSKEGHAYWEELLDMNKLIDFLAKHGNEFKGWKEIDLSAAKEKLNAALKGREEN